MVFVVSIAGSYVLAMLSWYVMEKPILGLKRYFVE